VPGAGTFLRPSPALDFGRAFVPALSAKYVEDLRGGEETVVLGSSGGTIAVEAVRLDMIRANLARLEHLREVSLDDVAAPGPPGAIAAACPSVYAGCAPGALPAG
jgi:hypothetical protein